MKEVKKNTHDKMFWTECYDDQCCMHLSDKKDSRWYSKSSRKNHFYTATHCQSEVHNENSDESSFTIIVKSKIFNSKAYDSNRLNNIKKAIHQAVKEESQLSETLWTFTIAAENALKQEENCFEVKKDFRKLTS